MSVRPILDIDIFVNCIWVGTRWQQYSTHLHTNNRQNKTINLGRGRAVPRLCESYPGVCLTTDEKARKNLNKGRKTSVRVQKFQSRWKNLSQGRKVLWVYASDTALAKLMYVRWSAGWTVKYRKAYYKNFKTKLILCKHLKGTQLDLVYRHHGNK